mgnify:FL=1
MLIILTLSIILYSAVMDSMNWHKARSISEDLSIGQHAVLDILDSRISRRSSEIY